MRLYAPFRDSPDLYLRFSQLNPRSRRQLVQFANEYGHLSERIRAAPGPQDPDPEPCDEDPGWQLEHDFTLLLRGRSGSDDACRIHRAGDEIWTEWSEESVWLWRESIVAVRDVLKRAEVTPTTGEKHALARRNLFEMVEQNLPGRIRVMPLDGTDLAPRPVNLLGVIWLQVAAHVTGQVELRPCAREGCGRMFRVGEPVSPSAGQHGRSTRRYCTDVCRNAAGHQERKRRRARDTSGG